jgi:hypothetical protein
MSAYQTSNGRTIEHIAEHAIKYALDHYTAILPYNEVHAVSSACSCVISVAVVQVTGIEGNRYDADRCLVGDLMRGRETGAAFAAFESEHFNPSSVRADRLLAIAEVIELSIDGGVDHEPLKRCAAELRIYASESRQLAEAKS